jgi:alpha-glucosidase (family GH31 glycosyl hydrolase)
MRFKYVMLAYTRTQVFKQINWGTPVVRPMFFEALEPDYSNVGT